MRNRDRSYESQILRAVLEKIHPRYHLHECEILSEVSLGVPRRDHDIRDIEKFNNLWKEILEAWCEDYRNGWYNRNTERQKRISRNVDSFYNKYLCNNFAFSVEIISSASEREKKENEES